MSESAPRFSPDGASIAFSRTTGILRPTGHKASIATIRPDGGRSRTLARGLTTPGAPPEWSPDGRWIASSPSGGFGIRVIAASSGRIVATLPAGEAAWSPGGGLIAYPTPEGIELFRPRNRRRELLVPLPRNREFMREVAWSPNGRLLAYADEDGLELSDVRTRSRRLVFRVRRDEGVDHIAWAPDSRRIAFTIFRDAPET